MEEGCGILKRSKLTLKPWLIGCMKGDELVPRKTLLHALAVASLVVILLVAGVVKYNGLWKDQKVKLTEIYPTKGWTASTPEEEGLDSTVIKKIYQYIVKNKINAHSMLIIRHGKIVSEAYFYPYQKDDMINIHSCTKSIISALIGIAIEEGYIKSVDQKITDFFPEYKIQNMSQLKQEITILHLLTMSAGLDFKHPDEDVKNSENWVQNALDHKMVAAPGTKFNYSDATAHLLSAIIQKATGMSTYNYANTHLFLPMGIKVYWPKDPQGINMGYGEINMTPRDMAKFGYLYLNNGAWEGKQLVPAKWVEESTKKQIKSDKGDGYGYLWWCNDGVFEARGSGEQYITVFPALNIVVVNTNGLDDGDSFGFGQFAGDISKVGEHPLPPDPDGLKSLRTLEKQLESPPSGQKKFISSLASKISGKTYYFPMDNPLNVKELIFDFSQEKGVYFRGIAFDGSQLEMYLPSDGSFVKDASRKNKNDTVFQKGYWQDDKTYVLVLEKSQKEIIYFHFENDLVNIRGINHGNVTFDNIIGSLKQ